MLYREIIAVCSEIHTQHINTLCGHNVELYIEIQFVPRSKHTPSLLYRMSHSLPNPELKILQRNLNRSTLVVWEMKRNVSVVRLIVATRSSGSPASGKIIKEMPGSVASGTPYTNQSDNVV